MPDQLRVGIIGCGQWGWNHLRTFQWLTESRVVRVADTSRHRLENVRTRYADVDTTEGPDAVLEADDLDAVVISTPTRTHYDLARRALEAGKHVLCEKPLTAAASESEELVALAHERSAVLMVGHVFVYNPGILHLREAVAEGRLGRIYYVDAVRTNLGPIRSDVGAIHDLASHDVSIFNFLLGTEPIAVSAVGAPFLQDGREDVAFITFEYPGEVYCHVHVSWLNPRKVRELTIVGDRRMAVWDDMEPLEMVRIYDKGLERKPFYDSFGEFQMILRDANVTIPKLEMFEPLAAQARDFVTAVVEGGEPRARGRDGWAVVRALEAALESLRHQGRSVPVAGGAADTA